ncbi:hypothetical protein J2T20_001517 [Paenibacillus wynnii]|nr:hypothetical protein [Paenibacillus wynnii]
MNCNFYFKIISKKTKNPFLNMIKYYGTMFKTRKVLAVWQFE